MDLDSVVTASKERIEHSLKLVISYSEKFEQELEKLVKWRAWDVLGYRGFSEMWRDRTGNECPQWVQVLVVKAMAKQNPINTKTGPKPNGITRKEIGEAAGLRYDQVSNVLFQLGKGVPTNKVKTTPRKFKSGNKDEFVAVTFQLARRDKETMYRISREMGVDQAVVYRHAVSQFIAHFKGRVGAA